METTPDMLELDSGGGGSEEGRTETPPPESPPLDKADFEKRVENLMAMMEDDPKVRDRIIAEIYVNIASAEMGIRSMAEAVQKQGIAGLMKGAFSRGG